MTQNAIPLLQDLIRIESFSGSEDKTADRIQAWFKDHSIPFHRQHNNVWATNKHFDPKRPTLLLNSHHDTVKPNQAYTRNPFSPDIVEGKLYGLGSNDAGGALVSLLSVFTHFYAHPHPQYNMVMAATGEEETAGENSLRGLLPSLPHIDVALVGEPTQMELAIAEKGLIVFDLTLKGTASHAAHPNEDNPILKIKSVFESLERLHFEKVSDLLGPVKVTLTQVNAGSQHNIVPSEVQLVLDVRVNDCYTNAEIEALIQNALPCEVKARSLRLGSSSIAESHPLVQAGLALGKKTYGSPTLSDQAALSCPSLKMGPGDSPRSHTADEFIYVREIEEGIALYITLLTKLL
ncbi:MAG: M20 family metallo-hydrolase [Bacteroidetes bacterium]|jgi:acetylornithine deacetylase|nr:M20 family metallo-hydrolase [Bacteroidota bacterium]MDA0922098.1 M20 family metallo-hydrolase [Bacteroidota bacterium]MDA1287999.1 M20 family metallo-hydrolase [Bacteroidota bacterium]